MAKTTKTTTNDTTEKLRLDKYLWAIRLFKTRTLAATACDTGKVKLLGDNCKAAKAVKVLDIYEVKTDAKNWVIQVAALLHNRLAYSEAVNYYIDKTPTVDPLATLQYQAASFNTGKRQSKVGRPTKKNAREIDAFVNDTNTDL